ncbi:MAG: GNAT family N-acetyltransferase [Methyloceanibacter sp.]
MRLLASPSRWCIRAPGHSLPVCYLEDLFVDPAARGRCIGRALIEDLLQRLPPRRLVVALLAHSGLEPCSAAALRQICPG